EPGNDLHSLDFCSYCIKYLTFLWNLLFSVLGLLILAFGIWGLLAKESLVSERIAHLGSDPMLFFVLVGLAVSTVSLAGCVGALYENTCLLKFFTGGAVLRYQDDPDLRFIMDEIQMGLQCCGAESYQDWQMNIYFNCSSPGVQACGVPASCCLNPLENGTITNSQCGFGALGMEEFEAQSIISLGGCVPQLSRWLRGHRGVLSAYFVFLILLEVGGFLLATKLLADLAFVRAPGWQPGPWRNSPPAPPLPLPAARRPSLSHRGGNPRPSAKREGSCVVPPPRLQPMCAASHLPLAVGRPYPAQLGLDSFVVTWQINLYLFPGCRGGA
uniref:Tetraspanin-10 n=1 Tax=Gopherus evgoodei TaxID=1825980 RepID=A0A8C4VZD8_9SAUR